MKDQFAKLRWFFLREYIGEQAKIILKLLFPIRKHVLTNNQRTLSNSKNVLTLIQGAFSKSASAESTSELAKGQITKLFLSFSRKIREEPKIIFKLLFLTQKRVLTNNHRALSNSKNALTLIQGALADRVCPIMGERSIY